MRVVCGRVPSWRGEGFWRREGDGEAGAGMRAAQSTAWAPAVGALAARDLRRRAAVKPAPSCHGDGIMCEPPLPGASPARSGWVRGKRGILPDWVSGPRTSWVILGDCGLIPMPRPTQLARPLDASAPLSGQRLGPALSSWSRGPMEACCPGSGGVWIGAYCHLRRPIYEGDLDWPC